MNALLGIARFIDNFNDRVGRAVAWLTLFMVIVTVIIVVLRYGFNIGFIWMQESVRFMHAFVFLLCAAYTYRHNEHVRVDIFYLKMSERGKAWIDLFGNLAFLIPVCGLIIWSSIDYVLNSWSALEGSLEERGLHAVFLLKTCIWIFAGTMIAQGLSRIIHCIATITGFEHAPPDTHEHAL
ncbi:MAG: TRAP transporter small permease subunit [Alphaproteobacteria bacterium]